MTNLIISLITSAMLTFGGVQTTNNENGSGYEWDGNCQVYDDGRRICHIK
jgi:hypothetical protein